MKLKTGTYYKTRNGMLAYVSGTNPDSKIWEFIGEVIGADEYEFSWTSFGGISSRYNSSKDVDNPKWHEYNDLVEEFPKEDYPEYYL